MVIDSVHLCGGTTKRRKAAQLTCPGRLSV